MALKHLHVGPGVNLQWWSASVYWSRSLISSTKPPGLDLDFLVLEIVVMS